MVRIGSFREFVMLKENMNRRAFLRGVPGVVAAPLAAAAGRAAAAAPPGQSGLTPQEEREIDNVDVDELQGKLQNAASQLSSGGQELHRNLLREEERLKRATSLLQSYGSRLSGPIPSPAELADVRKELDLVYTSIRKIPTITVRQGNVPSVALDPAGAAKVRAMLGAASKKIDGIAELAERAANGSPATQRR